MKKYLKFIFLILWIGIIFAFSSQVATDSRKLSRGVTVRIIEVIKKVRPNTEINVYLLNRKIRKFAHFINYMILGIITAFVLKKNKLGKKKILLFSLLFCIIIASLDEYYQSFIPGRGARLKDVFIDSFGALVGIELGRIIENLKLKMDS